MLHKAYPALNLSRHLAHLTGTQKKPEREPQAHTADDGTHAKKPLQFLSPFATGWPLSGSIKISRTVNKQKHVVAKKMQLSSLQESWELTCSNSESVTQE